jgi:hypothetical protein
MNGYMQFVPWILCAVTAAWFGLLARSEKRGWLLWTLGGGAFALVASTIVIGLGNAVFIPYSSNAVTRFHIEITATACVLVALLGWLFTMKLHGHHRSLLARFFPAPQRQASIAPKSPSQNPAQK